MKFSIDRRYSCFWIVMTFQNKHNSYSKVIARQDVEWKYLLREARKLKQKLLDIPQGEYLSTL